MHWLGKKLRSRYRDRVLIANRNQFHGRSKNYSQYLQLAISIAVDLRLDRRGIRQKPDEGSKRDPIVRDGYKGEGNAESAAQRAAAGVFYIASTCVALFGTAKATANQSQYCKIARQDEYLCLHAIH